MLYTKTEDTLTDFNFGNNITKQGTAVAQWLMFCATNRKVAGLIPAGDIGIFH